MASKWGFVAFNRSSKVEREEKSMRGYEEGWISWHSFRG